MSNIDSFAETAGILASVIGLAAVSIILDTGDLKSNLAAFVLVATIADKTTCIAVRNWLIARKKTKLRKSLALGLHQLVKALEGNAAEPLSSSAAAATLDQLSCIAEDGDSFFYEIRALRKKLELLEAHSTGATIPRDRRIQICQAITDSVLSK